MASGAAAADKYPWVVVMVNHRCMHGIVMIMSCLVCITLASWDCRRGPPPEARLFLVL